MNEQAWVTFFGKDTTDAIKYLDSLLDEQRIPQEKRDLVYVGIRNLAISLIGYGVMAGVCIGVVLMVAVLR
jgi:hypothetical protein